MTDDSRLQTSNEDTVAELEAAAAKWVLEKNKYTLECLRDARKAVLARMLSGDPSQVETKKDERIPTNAELDVLLEQALKAQKFGNLHTPVEPHLIAHACAELLQYRSAEETKPKPTIEGLERLLQAEDSKQVYVWPDGYVHDTPPPEKAPEAHIDYNVPGCDCLGCELAPKTLVEVRAFGTSIDPPSQKALAPRYELPLEWQAREWTEIDSPSSLCGLLGCNRQTPHHHKAAL